MTTIINGSSPSITFSDSTTQTTAFTTGAVTQSTIATGVAGTGPAFSAYNTSIQTLSNNTATKIAFQTKEFDTASAFDSSTNYRFTPLVAGYYQVTAALAWYPSTVGVIQGWIYKNGTAKISGSNNISNSNGSQFLINGLVYLNGSTDYIEIYGYQSSGANLQIAAAGTAGTIFQAAMVRAA